MLRYALGRILWSIPTLLGTSLVVFFVTTLAPSPVALGGEVAISASAERLEEARRARFADLPRFVNGNPQDVRTRALAAVSLLAAGGTGAAVRAGAIEGARVLVHLGGAALPVVIPLLDTLPPDARGRVAIALGPVAERMHLASPADLAQPEAAALFWTRFWDDRALDYSRAAVERAVTRLVHHGGDLRERDLIALDTFALPELIQAMTATRDPATLTRLTRLAHHATERGPVVDEDAPPDEARRAIGDWQEWWFVNATDFTAVEGAGRVSAAVTETQYGKWLRRAISGQLGLSSIDGVPIADKLKAYAPVTLLVCGLATLLSWMLAVPIGAIGAWRRGRPFDVASSAVMFVLYATPTFGLAELLRRVAGSHDIGSARVALAVAALAIGSTATTSRWQRAAMLDVVRQDFVRTAHAKGVPGWRVLVVHALRNALMPVVTLAGLHLPALVGGAFVVEEVFQLPGIGYETLRAIEAHDSAWLMAVLLAAAVAITLGLIASDLVYGALDPRVRDVLGSGRRRRL